MILDGDILDHIEFLRHQRNWSFYKLENKSSMNKGQISKMINNGHTPSFYTLQRICNGFGITVSEFFAQIESEEEATIKLSTKDYTQLLHLYDTLTAQQQYNVLVYICGMLGLPATIDGK